MPYQQNKLQTKNALFYVIALALASYSLITIFNNQQLANQANKAGTSESVLIPQEIATLFKEINKTIGSNIQAKSEDKFYSINGDIDKKSWKLDLNSTVGPLTKTQHIAIGDVLSKTMEQDWANSADGARGDSVQAFKNEKIYCFWIRMNGDNSVSCTANN